MGVEFKDYSIQCKEALNDVSIAWLYEASGELQAAVQRNTRVDTGQLKGSWSYHVDESSGESTIGSPLQNAIWEEFGTGEYAINGNGRKTHWAYQDRQGHWHKTTGKKPNRALESAFKTLEKVLQKSLQDKLKGMK